MKIIKGYKLYLAIALLSLGLLANAQENKGNLILATIPFELTAHNNLSIKGVFNKKDTVKLMFHTAASAISLTTEAIKSITSINWDAETNVSSWGGKSTARVSKSNSLEINNLKWDSLPVWESRNSGPTTGGKFGPNLFEGKIIEMDFDKSVIIIYKELPQKAANFVKVKLFYEDESMFLEGLSTIKGKDYKNKFLIHSGYGGTILYDDKFAAESKIGEQIEILAEKELKDSYGNVLKTKKGELPKFKVGGEVFTAMPVGFFEGAIGRQQMSVIGGDLLKRFNLIIDSNRSYIYMKPNEYKKTIYNKL